MEIKTSKQKIFEMKLKNLGFDMKDDENSRVGKALGLFAEKSGTSQSHIIKCLEDGIRTYKRLYPCKPDIFEMTYEEVAETETQGVQK